MNPTLPDLDRNIVLSSGGWRLVRHFPDGFQVMPDMTLSPAQYASS